MREVKTSLGDLGLFEHIVFLGTYNANPFKENIFNWITQLDLTATALVVADNASTDGSEEWIRDLIDTLSARSYFIRNERNLGGYGNLAANLSSFSGAKWVTTLHQDDIYLPDHVQKHIRLIRQAPPNLGMICSESISISEAGAKIPNPRAHWLLENVTDPVTLFLAHLRQHAFPFSGASISVEVLKRYQIPWHSKAFPDTELVMKMIADYRVEFTKGVSVRYFENPESESHSLSSAERDFGAFMALSRVFAHPNFKKICLMIPILERKKFFDSLAMGISMRIEDTYLSNILTHVVMEIISEHLPMDKDLSDYLIEGYLRIGDYPTVQHLQSIYFNAETPIYKIFPTKLDYLVGRKSKFRQIIFFGAKLLPRDVQKFIFKIFMSTRFGKHMLPNWNLDWKKK